MAHDVFISHSVRNKVTADAVCSVLEDRGIRCWVAPRDIRAGETWGGAIISAISSSRVMVLIFSNHSNSSPQVMREVERAVQKGLVVVPFRIEAVEPSGDMEYFLSTTHWLDALSLDLNSHIHQLADIVKSFLMKDTVTQKRREEEKESESFSDGPRIAIGKAFTGGSTGSSSEAASSSEISLKDVVPVKTKAENEREHTTQLQRYGFTNTIGMKFVYIHPGEFIMGSPSNEEGRSNDELQHPMEVTKGFMLGITPVTQGEWAAVMKTTPWSGDVVINKDDKIPAVPITWENAVEFCERLSRIEGRMYRLPTEAEWEYACRAGTKTAFSFGNDIGKIHEFGWCYHPNEFLRFFKVRKAKSPRPVGLKKPNAWGLYDMHGNVTEWCKVTKTEWSNTWHDKYKGICRGGSINSDPSRCRSAQREWSHWRDFARGFRVALDFPEDNPTESSSS